jgi:tRNA (guanine-N7-)-methyltransferase
MKLLSNRPLALDKVPPPPADSIFDLEAWTQGRPLDVEIGCGVGLHPIRYTLENQDRCLVAMEHTRDKFESFLRRYQNHQRPANLRPLHVNAISWLCHVPPLGSISRVFLLYPNPYPKGRDRHRRWPYLPFMQQVHALLKPGGELIFASNFLDYAQDMQEIMTARYAMTVRTSQELSLNGCQGVQGRTHFEQKYLSRGEICYNLVFVKH